MSGTDLTTTKQPGSYMPDNLRNPEVAPIVDVLHSGLISVQGRDTLERLPTYAERVKLENRLGEIQRILRPASMAEAEMKTLGAALAVMLGGWLNNRADASSTIQNYKVLVKDLPLWCVLAACRDFTDGEAYEEINGERKRLSPDFAPSAARLKVVARAKLDDVIAEQDRIRRLLSVKLTHLPAEALDPESRARVGEEIRALADGFKAATEADRKRSIAEAKAKADEARARSAKIREDAERPVLAEYAARGMQPVRAKNGMLLHPDIAASLPKD